MKPVHEMTDQELNEAIARIRNEFDVKVVFVKIEDGYQKTEQTFFPDYCNSWQCAGELLEEMAKPNLRPSLFYCENFKWTCNISILEPEGRYFEHKVSVRNCVFPTRAIAEAWYEVNK